TDSIAKEIVSDANAKEFLGKDSVKVKDIEVHEDSFDSSASKEANNEKVTSLKNVKKEKNSTIISEDLDNDEWESF
ncbi:chemotaxis protein, partial [Arcobacter sp. CECT 8985]